MTFVASFVASSHADEQKLVGAAGFEPRGLCHVPALLELRYEGFRCIPVAQDDAVARSFTGFVSLSRHYRPAPPQRSAGP